MIYMIPIYAALTLSIIGLLSPYWRLHASMAVISIATLFVVDYFMGVYIFHEHTKLVTAFFDALFGAGMALSMIHFEPKTQKAPRIYKYYTIILSVFLFTSLLNVTAWSMGITGVYDGSYLKSAYNSIVLIANVVQVLCLIEGGRNGVSSLVTHINYYFTRDNSIHHH